MKTKVALFVMLCMACSCLDMFTDSSSKVTGKFYLVHIDGHTNDGNMLGFDLGNGNYQNVISDKVITIRGNDSLLYVVSGDINGGFVYHLIKHQSGAHILSEETITSGQYDKAVGKIPFKYSYDHRR